jgi:hypothetical protein
VKYFTYHPVPVQDTNYKQHILSSVKVTKYVIHWLNFVKICLFEFIWVAGCLKLVKHFKGVASYKSLGTPGLVAIEKGARPVSPILEDPQPK